MRAIMVLGLVSLMLAGCGSSPKTHFYALTVVTGSRTSKASPTWPVQIAAVHVPPSLDRQQMVKRTVGNSVDISDQNRWAAPLGDMIRNVLTQDLAVRLPKGKVILPDAPAPQNTRQIVATIAGFGPTSDGNVKLDGSWSLLGGSPAKSILSHDISLETQPPGPGGGGIAAAMSTLLGRLANRMTSELVQMGSSK